ncbi:hypothetical protein AvCA_16710 [Azotobacter vinelandii CA]|uniref:Uncharacterized protein n=2 Tax=Azotobacter vinelandii TaxID=354 RepID=C1DSC9_AZOVD|nr:hypothetical protein Avin_16710 [Azotobacter vinelandii DJ]AGK15235.1 hypothetical protein AvCA_16710 [Azotobacter vinelandii CA]AGK20048.1 hypothetical protein AvCA6_16710 [Azotobacter vinelandii CA6]
MPALFDSHISCRAVQGKKERGGRSLPLPRAGEGRGEGKGGGGVLALP